MQNLIAEINTKGKLVAPDETSVSNFYDKYAPALYGTILRVVQQKEIADKLLEKVFINALVHNAIDKPNHITLFTTLLNYARKKSFTTIKALKLLQACSCGSPVQVGGSQ